MHPTSPDRAGTLLGAVLAAIQRGYRVHTCRLERATPDARKEVTAAPPRGWHTQAQQSFDAVRSAISFGGHNAYLVHGPSSGVTLLDGDSAADLARHHALTGITPHVVSPSGPDRAHTYVRGVYGTSLDPKVKSTAFGPGSYVTVRSTGATLPYVGDLPAKEALPVPRINGQAVVPTSNAPTAPVPSLLAEIAPPKTLDAARTQWDRLAADVTAEVRRSVTSGRWDRDRLLALSWELAQLSPETAHRDWASWFRAGGAVPDHRDVALVETGLGRGRPDKIVRSAPEPRDSMVRVGGPDQHITPVPLEIAGLDAAPTIQQAHPFWDARPELRRIHDFARSRRAAPLAVLGAVLVEVAAMVEPTVQLPAIVGSRSSLNLFLALVGRPGAGKDIAQDVAREAVRIAGSLPGVEFAWADRLNLGSGQGLAHSFMAPAGRGEAGPTQVRTRAVLSAGEIDTLASHAAMKGATLLSELRKLWMGQAFGHQYADATRRVPVSAHSYRACLVAGVQPERSSVLLSDGDGGTPQRFLWLPAEDGDAPDVAPPEPEPWLWTPPLGAIGSTLDVEVCAVARTAIDADRLARLRGQGDGMDAHALLGRLKVGAALGVLAGRHSVTEEDWVLAGALMELSDATRARCAAALAEQAKAKNEAQARAEADRGDYQHRRAIERVAQHVHTKLADGPRTRAELRRTLASRDRALFDAAIELLTVSGQIAEHAELGRTTYRWT